MLARIARGVGRDRGLPVRGC